MSALCVAITPSAVMMWVLYESQTISRNVLIVPHRVARFSSAFRSRRDGQAYEIFELFHQGDSA